MSARGASPKKSSAAATAGGSSGTATAGPRPSRQPMATSTPIAGDRGSASAGSSTTNQHSPPLERPGSPMSPNLLTRDDEKRQLSHLNNRLAAYIDHVNQLQNANSKLTTTLSRIEEQKTTEITNVKKDYQKEIDALRRLVDDEAREKATAQTEADNLQKQLDRLSAANQALLNDHDRANTRISILEKDNADLKARTDAAVSQVERLKRELAAIANDHRESEAKLKAETIKASTVRNQLESFRDEHKFQKDTFERELQIAKTVRQEEISEIDGRAQARYDVQLQEKIEEFRRVYEIEKGDLRSRMEDEISRRLEQYAPMDEFSQLESKLSSVTQELTTVKTDLDEKRRMLDQERSWREQQLRSKDDQIAEANRKFRDLKKDFDDLCDIKEGLQRELETYRVLLEQEENRLNLSATQSPSTSGLAGRSILSTSESKKRKRLASTFETMEGQENIQVEASNSGPIIVGEHDAVHGKFVVVENTSSEDVLLGGWKISHQSGEVVASHKLPSRFKIRGNSKITLWSSDSNGEHNPPNSYVLKDIKFPAHGEDGSPFEVVTEIRNSEDMIIATRISRKSQLTKRSRASTTQRAGAGRIIASPTRVSFGPGQVFHTHGDEQVDAGNAHDESRCSIM